MLRQFNHSSKLLKYNFRELNYFRSNRMCETNYTEGSFKDKIVKEYIEKHNLTKEEAEKLFEEQIKNCTEEEKKAMRTCKRIFT